MLRLADRAFRAAEDRRNAGGRSRPCRVHAVVQSLAAACDIDSQRRQRGGAADRPPDRRAPVRGRAPARGRHADRGDPVALKRLSPPLSYGEGPGDPMSVREQSQLSRYIEVVRAAAETLKVELSPIEPADPRNSRALLRLGTKSASAAWRLRTPRHSAPTP